MGQAVPIRTDYAAGEVRRLAKRAKDGAQARRLLALAAVLDGVSREEAARLGGMDQAKYRPDARAIETAADQRSRAMAQYCRTRRVERYLIRKPSKLVGPEPR